MVPQTAPHLAHLDGGIDGRQHSSPAGVADGLTAGTLCGDAIGEADGALDGAADGSALCDDTLTAQTIVDPKA